MESNNIIRVIEDIKELKKVLKYIQTFNQMFKNLKKDSCYTLQKINCWCYKSDKDDVGHNLITIIDPMSVEYKFSGYVVGKELYTFLKYYKKNINQIILREYNFSLLSPDTIYDSVDYRLREDTDIKPIREFRREYYSNPKNYEEFACYIRKRVEYPLSEDIVKIVKISNCPCLIKIPFHDFDIKVKLTPKLFVVEENSKLVITPYNVNKNLYSVILESQDGFLLSETCFIICNY